MKYNELTLMIISGKKDEPITLPTSIGFEKLRPLSMLWEINKSLPKALLPVSADHMITTSSALLLGLVDTLILASLIPTLLLILNGELNNIPPSALLEINRSVFWGIDELKGEI